LAIAKQLQLLLPEVRIGFVSYGTGAATFRELGHAVTDLDLPDRPGLFGVERKLPELFEASPRPALVVAHEEFSVCPVARAYGIPAVLATDWLLDDPTSWQTASLKETDEVLFLDDEQVFTQWLFRRPAYAAEKVHCVGPVLRPLRFRDRRLARQQAGLPQDALVVAVFIHPGRRTEEVAPLREVLEKAFTTLPDSPKILLWDRDGDAEFDRTMAAADVAITKGNRNIVLELASLGTPSISVSHGLNTIDDLRTVSHRAAVALASNRTVTHARLTAPRLAKLMREMIQRGRSGVIPPIAFADGARGAAWRLADRLRAAAIGGSER
jgi:hypothetical protein